MKTLDERVKEALSNYNFTENENGINELIAYAYNLGRCEVANELCNKVHNIFAEQLKKAQTVRYHKQAEQIQGKIEFLYHSDYDMWIKMFSNDKTEC